MPLPNYKDGSIVNLMSSLSKRFHASSNYGTLSLLESVGLDNYKKIILLIIDGLGDEQLKKEKNSFLLKKRVGKFTSVFPSTTASAMTTYMTGNAPEEHAVTGWFMYLKEFGLVSTILPYVARSSWDFDLNTLLPLKKILPSSGFSSKIKVKSQVIYPQDISESNYSKCMFEKANVISYSSLPHFFSLLKNQCKKDELLPYTFAYIPDYDLSCHQFGTQGKKTKVLLNYLDKEIEKLSKQLDSETLLIISADHGHIDTPRTKWINFDKDKEIKECLLMPLCGEPRAAYVYVQKSKIKKFEKTIKKKYAKVLECHKSELLIKKGYYGVNKIVSEKLNERIGDYVLIPKEEYALVSYLENEKEEFDKSCHGGISENELFIPLILVKKE